MTPRWGNTLHRLSHDLIFSDSKKHDLSRVTPTWEDLTRHYFAQESQLRPKIDSAARHMAKHKTPPNKLPADVRYYLGLRFGCAMDFLGMIFPPQAAAAPFDDISPDWSDERLIEWLLIDLWVRRFDHWLKPDAISVMGPFAFYGLKPADPTVAQ